jgi:hypothetical protein
VGYQLKTPHNKSTAHVVFEPLYLLARLAVLGARPRVNLTRYHGVFAPNSAYRALVTKADARTPGELRIAMRWAQRLKRVFGIDVQTCAAG